MKILVYGTGPLGSLFAARLKAGGHDISILARGQRLADLREYGIVLEDALTGERTTTRVDIVEQLASDDAYDLVIVLMRKNQVAAILPTLAANRHTPNILFMGNNAAGPDEYIGALGRERVLLGFGGAGGMRAGYVMRVIAETRGRKATVTIGELDGRITPRLKEIASVFESAGFQAVLSPNIDTWLKSHAAVISPIALALYMVGGDNYRLARTRDAMVLGIRAMRESFRVLRALDIPITPPALQVYEWLPEPILVPLVRRLFNTRSAEIAVAGHASAARDEMKQIADEFRTLTHSTTISTPVLDRLYAYLDPSVPTVAEGRAQIPLDWRGVWIGLSAMAGGIAALILVLKILRHR
jgi:2-dehydropantoate 2-reductase